MERDPSLCNGNKEVDKKQACSITVERHAKRTTMTSIANHGITHLHMELLTHLFERGKCLALNQKRETPCEVQQASACTRRGRV